MSDLVRSPFSYDLEKDVWRDRPGGKGRWECRTAFPVGDE